MTRAGLTWRASDERISEIVERAAADGPMQHHLTVGAYPAHGLCAGVHTPDPYARLAVPALRVVCGLQVWSKFRSM